MLAKCFQGSGCIHPQGKKFTHTNTTVLRSFFWDNLGEPVPEENFWTLWCKGRLTEADTPTIRLGATPSGLTSAHIHHPPIFFTGRMPFLPPNQQCQSTEGKKFTGAVFCSVDVSGPSTNLGHHDKSPLSNGQGCSYQHYTNDKTLTMTKYAFRPYVGNCDAIWRNCESTSEGNLPLTHQQKSTPFNSIM